MKKYLVRLNIIIGEYEKSAHALVLAAGKEEAEIAALKGESHQLHAAYDDDGHWWDGDFIYEVNSIKELNDGQWNMLKGLL